MKKIIIALSFLFLSACGGGDSDSGGSVENTAAGDSLPENFVGTYTGSIEVTASGLGLTVTETFDITITVNDNGTIDFQSDGETFSAGIANDGNFSVSVDIDEEECTGTVSVTGSVDGTTASGNGSGEGQCVISGTNVDVTLEAEFTATM